MDLQQALELAYSLLTVITFVAGLYLARLFLPDLFHLLESTVPSKPLRGPVLRLVVMLSLGTLLTFPLLDLLGFVRLLVETLSRPMSQEMWVSPWGSAPEPEGALLWALLVLAAYGGVLWSVKQSRFLGFVASGTSRLSAVRPHLIALSMGSLVASFVKTVVVQVIWPPFAPFGNPADRGALGFAAGWVFALLLLAALALQALAWFPEPSEQRQ